MSEIAEPIIQKIVHRQEYISKKVSINDNRKRTLKLYLKKKNVINMHCSVVLLCWYNEQYVSRVLGKHLWQKVYLGELLEQEWTDIVERQLTM